MPANLVDSYLKIRYSSMIDRILTIDDEFMVTKTNPCRSYGEKHKYGNIIVATNVR